MAGEALWRVAAGDEHRAHQKSRCAADADQCLAKHQPLEAMGKRREHRAGHRERERGQHGAADAMQVDADADEDLHGAEGEVKGAREGAERLRGGSELSLQLWCHQSGDCAIRLAQREATRQCHQHDDARRLTHRGAKGVGRGHCAFYHLGDGGVRSRESFMGPVLCISGNVAHELQQRLRSGVETARVLDVVQQARLARRPAEAFSCSRAGRGSIHARETGEPAEVFASLGTPTRQALAPTARGAARSRDCCLGPTRVGRGRRRRCILLRRHGALRGEHGHARGDQQRARRVVERLAHRPSR